jgi:hypothetical protein
MSQEDRELIKATQFPPAGYKVKRAVLHASFPVPEGGGETESMYQVPGQGIGRSAVTGVSMTYTTEGLFCEFKGAAFIIPLANVKGVWL